MLVKILMLCVFFAVTVGIGLYCRKSATNVSDFVLGGRNVGPWITAFAYGTSYFSAVVFVGYAGQFGYDFGVSAVWIGLGNAFVGGLLAWIVLGKRTRIMTNHMKSSTMPDFFSKRYKSEKLKLISSVIIFVFLIPYSASVYKGLSGLFSMSFGINFTYCVIGIAVLTGIYVVAGGYMAAALNDLFQGIIMLVGIVLVVFAVMNGKGGFTEAMTSLSQIQFDNPQNITSPLTSIFGSKPFMLLSVVILTSLGTWGLPQMLHKFYAIKSKKAIKAGAIITTVFALIISGGSYFLGSFGRLYYTVPQDGKVIYDNIVPEMLSQSLGNVLMGIVIVLVLSASMSTLSSLVITSSSTIVLDFLKPFTKKANSDKKEVVLIKGFCVLFIILSVVLALIPNSLISSLMSISWGALSGAFLGPFLYGIYSKKATIAGVYATFGVSIGITVINMFVNFTNPISAGAIAILLSLVVLPIVSLFTKKPPEHEVNSMFKCFKEQ